jgi:recombinational DNA repair protein RecR
MEFLDFGDMPKMTPIIGKLPKLGTNKAEILMFLLSGDQPTNKQMGHTLDCVSSAARICELRQDGWLIEAHKIPYRTERERCLLLQILYYEFARCFNTSKSATIY